MATRKPETTESTEATEPVAIVERNPAEPIGNPPGGGRWTWDVPLQKWVSLNSDTQATAE